jgi:hypothetical protein
MAASKASCGDSRGWVEPLNPKVRVNPIHGPRPSWWFPKGPIRFVFAGRFGELTGRPAPPQSGSHIWKIKYVSDIFRVSNTCK